MDVAAWVRESRVWIVAGKGGVGKTTVTAALARAAADAGLSVLVVELEGKPGLGAAFGSAEPLGYETVVLAGAPTPDDETRPSPGSVFARRITPDDALLDYLADHGLHRVSRRLVASGVLDVVATAVPGIRDVLVLGKVKQLTRADAADVVIVDAPGTGHTMTFLSSAGGLIDAARSGPVRTQAQDVVELLRDPARCRVVLVTLPEELPVSETVEAAYQLEDRVGIHLGPVVVNCYDPPIAGLDADIATAANESGVSIDPAASSILEQARDFRLRRIEVGAEQVERLARELPLPQLRIPRIGTRTIGPAELDQLAVALSGAIGTAETASESTSATAPVTESVTESVKGAGTS